MGSAAPSPPANWPTWCWWTGRPDERIGDIENTRRVFLGGVELAPPDLEQAIQSKALTPLPLQRVAALIDDMEGAGGRTQLGTLRVNGTDSGVDHSAMLMLPVVRAGSDHALLVAAQMADKDRPFVRVEFPLTPGAISPADLSAYTGVSFDLRGEAAGRLLVQAYHVRNMDAYAAPFTPGGAWQTVKIPFSSLRRRAGRRRSLGRQGRASATLRTEWSSRFECLGGIGQRTVLLKEVCIWWIAGISWQPRPRRPSGARKPLRNWR